MANEVRYALTLESRQFIQELAKARQSAKDTARQVKDGGDEAGSALKVLGTQFQDTQRLGMGFAAAQNALALAMAGNFVGTSLPIAMSVASRSRMVPTTRVSRERSSPSRLRSAGMHQRARPSRASSRTCSSCTPGEASAIIASQIRSRSALGRCATDSVMA